MTTKSVAVEAGRSRLRLRKARLFEELGYEPHEGQRLVHRSKAPRRIVAAGARWGKSTAASMEAVAALLTPREESAGWIVSATYDLCDRIFRVVEAIVTEKRGHRIVKLDSRGRYIALRNLSGGISTVEAKSTDHPASLLGAGRDWMIVDEAARIGDVVWQSHLSQRLLERRGWLFAISTPSSGGWFRDLFLLGQGDDPDVESWSSPSWVNPALDRDAIEAERRRLPADVFRAEYAGRFANTQGYGECRRCGGIQPESMPSITFFCDDDIRACDECGYWLDYQGRAVGSVWEGKPIPGKSLFLRYDRDRLTNEELQRLHNMAQAERIPPEYSVGRPGTR